MLLRMRTVAAVIAGFMLAFLCLNVLSLAGAIGPVELIVFGVPAFALGYWVMRRRRVGTAKPR